MGGIWILCSRVVVHLHFCLSVTVDPNFLNCLLSAEIIPSFDHICWNIYFCYSSNSNVQTFDISISIVSKTCLILPTWRLRFALFKNSISTTYLHPIVLFQRNKILPKVCYVCFLLSETKILMLGQILSYLPPVEMWEDLSQLSKLFPKLLILSLMNPLLEHVTW